MSRGPSFHLIHYKLFTFGGASGDSPSHFSLFLPKGAPFKVPPRRSEKGIQWVWSCSPGAIRSFGKPSSSATAAPKHRVLEATVLLEKKSPICITKQGLNWGGLSPLKVLVDLLLADSGVDLPPNLQQGSALGVDFDPSAYVGSCESQTANAS